MYIKNGNKTRKIAGKIKYDDDIEKGGGWYNTEEKRVSERKTMKQLRLVALGSH